MSLPRGKDPCDIQHGADSRFNSGKVHVAKPKSENNLAVYRIRRAAAIAQLGGKCVQCGSTEKLEFDHIDPDTKLATIGALLTASERRLQDELRKCQLLCKNCHVSKTSAQLGVPHGGGLTGKRNCRCDPCRLLRNKRLNELKKLRRKLAKENSQ